MKLVLEVSVVGLISKLEHKLQRAVTDKVTEKIITNGAEGAVNSAVKMLGKVTGQKTAPEYIKKAEKQILVVKSKSYSLKTLTHTFKRLAKGKLPNFGANQSRYLVVDRTGELKYRSDDTGDALDRTITNVYDSAGARIGYVQEHLNTMGIPMFEKNVKRCSVVLHGEKICTIKKYESFGLTEMDVTDGNINIKANDLCTHIELRNRNTRFPIGELKTVPFILKDGYVDKFVLEYNDPENEAIVVLLAIAVDSIKA